MNYHALCFVDMPFGQKPDLKSSVVVDFDQICNEAIKPAIESCDEEATAGLTLGYSEWEFLQRRCRQEGFEFGHLLPGGFLHPFFGSGGKGFLQSLLTQRLFLQSDVRFGDRG
jgi:hypothetical protein